MNRGQKILIIVQGKHSYGIEKIELRSWNERANLFIGSFCSIARNVVVLLGGNHRYDWATTFPFGFIRNDLFPQGASKAALKMEIYPIQMGMW